ncbi:PilZ domain-containing protein [Archangium lipolyticum]|uniref:PilZ domain-containing protein n=1 Tax=Archangium lipolyticum TaxID=2970465 RepID=UPI002149E2E9|nr:PilZ domain-containing protein [Archangium lipolyticum]
MRQQLAEARLQVESTPAVPGERTLREDITAPERIRSLLAAVAALGGKGLLRRDGRAVRVTLERVDTGAGALHWRTVPGEGWGPPPHEVEVVGYSSVLHLRLDGGTREAERYVTPLPTRLERVRHRHHQRFPAQPGTCLQLPLPGWLGREREVVDVSFGGLALRLRPGEQLAPGRVFQPVMLVAEGGERLFLRAEVRHVSTGLEGDTVCGFRVEPLSGRDAERWWSLVARAACPMVRTDGALVEEMWRLFIDSGYFNLAGRSAEWFEEQRTHFVGLGRRAAHLPHILSEAVWCSERGVEATISVMKPYRSLWLLHQLAKRQGGSRAERIPGQLLRDLYVRMLEHARGDPGLRWLAAYIETTVPFIHRTHVGFAQRMAGRAGVLLLPLRMIDVHCAELSGQGAEGLDIGPATASERVLLAEEIARTRPASYVEALDLGPEALDLEEGARPWRDAGLERERHILVARREGKPLAAAVLELGQRGTNPFLLLDATRLFRLDQEGGAACVALLDEARRWYARRGRESFVFMREDGDGSYAAAARLHEDSAGAEPCLWIIPADLVPEFLEHVHEQTVGRLPHTHEKESS